MQWRTPGFEEYRVIMKRRGRNHELDQKLLEFILRKRFLIYNFAAEKHLKMQHYTLLSDGEMESWDWRQWLLSFIDMYRTFASELESKRAKLYGVIGWTTCTFTILPSFKMILQNSDMFGKETESILEYCYNGYQAKKMKKREHAFFLEVNLLSFYKNPWSEF